MQTSVQSVRLYRALLKAQKQLPESLYKQKVAFNIRDVYELRREESDPQKIADYINEGQRITSTLSKLSKFLDVDELKR
jgi:hypothetical protein